MIIDEILEECAKKNASDIHLKEWEDILFRVHGELTKSSTGVRPNKAMMAEIFTILLYSNSERLAYFNKNLELDFWYVHTDKSVYRWNAFVFMGKVGLALRRIPENIQNLVELEVPKSIKHLLQAKHGLFLVTGPTWSGKSTTMASMLDAINEFRSEMILTIEDPIEYIFKNKKSVIIQREVGRDTQSFGRAIRAAMREDADIIMIGEIRDAETMETALSLAETGHFVISTLHTAGSVQTISRMIQFFPTAIETQIRTRIAESLIGVLSQRLVPRIDGLWGRIAIREIMYCTSAIRNLIHKWDSTQIPNVIETSTEEGMITMKKYATSLKDRWIIEEKSYAGYFTNDH